MPVNFHREIVVLPIDKVRPNEFNSNEVTPEEQEKIKEDIVTNGFIGAITVRSVGDSRYEIVDGEHRWIALRDLRSQEIPCIIINNNEDQAKINSIRLNTERGNQNPKKVGAIVKTLQEHGHSLESLSLQLVYDSPELIDRLDLLDLPDNIDDLISQREAYEREEMHMIFTFMVPASYREYVDKAIEMFGEAKGKSFGELCKNMVERENRVA